MKELEVFEFMKLRGMKLDPIQTEEAIRYVSLMLLDQRIIVILRYSDLHTVAFFSICNNPTPYQAKQTWGFLQHDPEGKVVFIEKMVTKGWNKEVRHGLEKVLINRFPQLEEGIWCRDSEQGDRKVTYRRRLSYV